MFAFYLFFACTDYGTGAAECLSGSDAVGAHGELPGGDTPAARAAALDAQAFAIAWDSPLDGTYTAQVDEDGAEAVVIDMYERPSCTADPVVTVYVMGDLTGPVSTHGEYELLWDNSGVQSPIVADGDVRYFGRFMPDEAQAEWMMGEIATVRPDLAEAEIFGVTLSFHTVHGLAGLNLDLRTESGEEYLGHGEIPAFGAPLTVVE